MDNNGDQHDVRADDQAAGFEITADFQRFNQRYDMFNRSHWDASVRSEASERLFETYAKPLETWKKADGYTQKDYALRNASWLVTDLLAEFKESENRREGFLDEYSVLREPAARRMPVESPEAMSAEVKRAAKTLGADLVGITDYDERWVYAQRYDRQSGEDKPNDLPDGLTSVIVIAVEMDYGLIQTVPSALSGAATGLGYSHDAVTLLSVAQYIRNLGYQAVPCLNDTALSIPLAIQAGLGEYGRNGLLITKEFGPRVRLGKIFTDLPLARDYPVRFGVREFCEICHRCATSCPSKALSHDAPSAEQRNMSTIAGVRKWSVDGERCFRFWTSQNSDCSICIRVCPYDKDYSHWWHRAALRLAGTPLRKLILQLDVWLGYGRRKRPGAWWGMRAR